MAIVRRVSNPFMRSMMALRGAQGTVFVIRHGSTDRNRGGVGQDQIRGHADIPMTAGGESEVLVTARMISAERLGVIYCSDLSRTERTAEIVSDENVGYPDVVPTAELRSWDMGAAMEGKTTTPDVVAQIRAWVFDDTVVPPGGESFRSFANRLIGYAKGVFDAALEHGDMVCIVAHGRCAQVIDFWCAAGCDEACMHREFAEYLAEEPDTVPPGGGIRYKHDGRGWIGQVIGSREASLGTQIAAGAYVRPANVLAIDENGMAS